MVSVGFYFSNKESSFSECSIWRWCKDLVPLLTSEKINLSDTDESDLVEGYDHYVTVGELEGISLDEWKVALIEGLNTPTDLPKPINYNLRDSPLHAGDFIIVPGESSAGGLVGHNGLVIGPDRILHSPGGQNAGKATVTTNIKSFMNKYGLEILVYIDLSAFLVVVWIWWLVGMP